MRIVYHLGAHFTDEERLLKCLLKNREVLAEHGIVVPGPKRYRNLLRDTAIQLKGSAASRDTQALILDKIMEEDVADRMILSWDSFLSLAPWALDGTLYPAAGERVRAFSQIFPEIEAEFHLAIRNPATFLPALLAKLPNKTYDDFIGKADIYQLHWSEVVQRILTLNPGTPLTIWCDEDTPLIWPEVLRAVAGLPEDVVLEGENELLATLMSGEGLSRLQSYLESHPPASTMQWRKIVSAFLDKFALPDRINTEVSMPGWTEATVEELTALYEEDVYRIAHMPGVQFIAP
ncbi:hypothetical protein [Cypionkella sinensis]|uniref:DUF1835 domain-containing protein n=1 Tax=Cypionkella sinensis TaxID=1756043 RepID=A0ABV7IWQ0_9RHOB